MPLFNGGDANPVSNTDIGHPIEKNYFDRNDEVFINPFGNEVKRHRFFPYTKKMIYSEYPCSNIKPYSEWSDLWLNNNPTIDPQEFNSLMFRSDEFKEKHEGLHVVFSGCSVTFGDGLSKEELWAYKVYSMINKDTECSGYFNLALSGSSPAGQVINLFKYFKQYGNPQYVFLNIPSLQRYFSYSERDKVFYDTFYPRQSIRTTELVAYQYYFMLEQYCKTNNIKLISFSWASGDDQNGFNNLEYINFDTFYLIDVNQYLTDVFSEVYENPDGEFLQTARDHGHPGIAHHNYWAKFAYSIYEQAQ